MRPAPLTKWSNINYDNLTYHFDKPLENKVGIYNISYEYTDNYFIANTNIKLTLLSFDL